MHIVDPAFANPHGHSSVFLLLAVYAYSFQIYMDLSGYTDIARGSARCLGYELPINFRRPYQALSVAEFWQRWHITMSSFFRDYIFYALRGRGSMYRNLMLVFVAIGFWHGAGWNFILYGVVHGSLVSAEVYQRNRRRRKRQHPEIPYEDWRKVLRIAWIFQLVAFARILFRAEDLTAAADYSKSFVTNWQLPLGQVALPALLALLGAIVLHYVPRQAYLRVYQVYAAAPAIVQAGALVIVILLLVSLRYAEAPFIYFQF
jgi:D-alanyl-lipoteichoic acid acyltransferase DltB (MBOAT superfamily)